MKKIFKIVLLSIGLGLLCVVSTKTPFFDKISVFFYEEATHSNGETNLHIAARFNRVDTIKLLLEKGAKVNATDHYGRTPLHTAAENNADGAAQLLVERSAFLEAKDYNGSSPLQIAVQNDSVDVVNVLIQHGADVTIKNPYGYGLLHLAAAIGNQKIIKLLVNKAPILLQEKYFKDEYGCTPLDMAKQRKFQSIENLFLPNLNPTDYQKRQFDKIATEDNLRDLTLNGQFTTFIEWARESHKESMIEKALALTPFLSKFSTVALPTGEYLRWPQGIAELHQLGLTGKNVSIGIVDFDLNDEIGHGPTVENIIQAIAPGVKIVRQEVVPTTNHFIIPHKSKMIQFKWSLRLKSLVDQILICHPDNQHNPLSDNKSSSHKIVIKVGEQITLFHGKIKNLVKIRDTFCYIDTLKNDLTTWELLDKMSISPNVKGGEVIQELIKQGVTIINYSKGIDGLLWNHNTFKQFSDHGGILIKSAGNYPYIPGKMTAKKSFLLPAIDLIHERWIEKSEHILIVGALEKDGEGNVFQAPYSTKAGIWRDKYITTVVDLKKHCQIETGTSFAAPQITGVVALLKEAFPNCSPQILARVLLETARPIENSSAEETGKGEMDPMKAYQKLQQVSVNLCHRS